MNQTSENIGNIQQFEETKRVEEQDNCIWKTYKQMQISSRIINHMGTQLFYRFTISKEILYFSFFKKILDGCIFY